MKSEGVMGFSHKAPCQNKLKVRLQMDEWGYRVLSCKQGHNNKANTQMAHTWAHEGGIRNKTALQRAFQPKQTVCKQDFWHQ